MPRNKYFVPAKEIQANKFLQVPKNELLVFFAQPPNFSTKPFLNLIKDALNHPPALV